MKRKPSSWASSATQQFNGTLILPLNIPPQVTGSTRQCIRTNKADLRVYAHANNSQVSLVSSTASQAVTARCVRIPNYGCVSELSAPTFISWIPGRIFDPFGRSWLQSSVAISRPGRADRTYLFAIKIQAASGKKGCALVFLRWPVGSKCSRWIKIGIFCLTQYQHIKILQLFFLLIVKCQFWSVLNSNHYDLLAEIITTSQEVTFVSLVLRTYFAGIFVPWLWTTFNFET